MGQIQSTVAAERLLQAQTLTHYATAAAQTLTTVGGWVSFDLKALVADPLSESIPDRDVFLDGVTMQITSAVSVTTLAWGLFRDAAGTVAIAPNQTSTPIIFDPTGTTTGSIVATLAGQPYMKLTGIGTSGSLYLRAQVSGVGATLDLKPFLHFRATLADTGVYK